MVILIGGASHTGKTLLAQRLMERYRYPVLSIDLLKMGLIRSGQTELTPEDDDLLTPYLWGIVQEIVKTAIENGQNLIAVRCNSGVRTPQPFFLGSQNAESIPADFAAFAGAFHAHHALAILRCPKIVVELNRGFHCLVLSAGAEQRKDKTYKEPHDSEQNPKPIKQKLQYRNSVHAAQEDSPVSGSTAQL